MIINWIKFLWAWFVIRPWLYFFPLGIPKQEEDSNAENRVPDSGNPWSSSWDTTVGSQSGDSGQSSGDMRD